MNCNAASIRTVSATAVLAMVLGTSVQPVAANETTLFKTNFVDRWITNLVEVQMPKNRFVEQFHTNWFERYVTNVNLVDAYETNLVTRMRTNRYVVDTFETNVVAAYRTNWNQVHRTNTFMVELMQTNFVSRYLTNTRVLNLTNWETMLVFQTNRVLQTVTNVVDIEVATNRAVVADSAKPAAAPLIVRREARVETPPPALPVAAWTDAFRIRANGTPGPRGKNLVDVHMMVNWANDPAAPLLVQQWRVEREDGSILCFGQEREFRRQLPTGKYNVEVKAQKDSSSPLYAARGSLEVTSQDAGIVQPPLARN